MRPDGGSGEGGQYVRRRVGVGLGPGDMGASSKGVEVVGDRGVIGERRGDEERVIVRLWRGGEDEEVERGGYGNEDGDACFNHGV